MVTVIIWMFLKGIGLINTPVLIQLIPYAGGIFAFGVFFQTVKGLKEEIKGIKVDLKDVKVDLNEMKFELNTVNVDLNDVKKSQQNMALDISEVKTRLGHVERSVS